MGRVIARPFIGESGNYTRTSNRHDFSLEPPAVTMLDQMKEAGLDVLAVGKINDILQERVLRNSYGLPEMKMVSIRHWSIWKEIFRVSVLSI